MKCLRCNKEMKCADDEQDFEGTDHVYFMVYTLPSKTLYIHLWYCDCGYYELNRKKGKSN